MAEYPREVIDAASRQREVTLTALGRKSGKPRRVTIWVTTDDGRIYIRSGGGMRRDWPQNLMQRGEATLGLGNTTIKVKPRHITDVAEARAVSELVRKKYGSVVRASKPDQQPTAGELASFELLPA